MPEFVGWIFHITFWSVHSRPAAFLLLCFIISPGWLERAAMQGSLELELLVTHLISSAETSQLNVLQSSYFFFGSYIPPSLLVHLCSHVLVHGWFFLLWFRCSEFPVPPDLIWGGVVLPLCLAVCSSCVSPEIQGTFFSIKAIKLPWYFIFLIWLI